MFTARYRRDPDAWFVEIIELAGVFSDGATLAEARANIREALAAALDNDEEQSLVEVLQLPPVGASPELTRAVVEGVAEALGDRG